MPSVSYEFSYVYSTAAGYWILRYHFQLEPGLFISHFYLTCWIPVKFCRRGVQEESEKMIEEERQDPFYLLTVLVIPATLLPLAVAVNQSLPIFPEPALLCPSETPIPAIECPLLRVWAPVIQQSSSKPGTYKNTTPLVPIVQRVEVGFYSNYLCVDTAITFWLFILPPLD